LRRRFRVVDWIATDLRAERQSIMSAFFGGKVSGIVVAFRTLAVGSVMGFAMHIYPIVQNTSVPNALILAQSEAALLAASGLGRIASNARRDPQKRAKFVEQGAIPVVAQTLQRMEAHVRKASIEALTVLMEDKSAAGVVLEDEQLVETLVLLPVVETASVWEVMVQQEGVRSALEKRGIYDRILLGNGDGNDDSAERSDDQERRKELVKTLKEGG